MKTKNKFQLPFGNQKMTKQAILRIAIRNSYVHYDKKLGDIAGIDYHKFIEDLRKYNNAQ